MILFSECTIKISTQTFFLIADALLNRYMIITSEAPILIAYFCRY